MKLIIVLLISFISTNIFALGSDGGLTFGLGFSTVASEQKHLNTIIADARVREAGLSLDKITSVYEASAIIQLRVPSTIFAFQLRPSFTWNSSEDGQYEYGVNGMNIGGFLKLYPMESDFMRAYFQLGMLWGKLTTTIKEDTFEVEASGSSVGYLGGLGFEFFFGGHTFFLEACWRSLTIKQNMIDSSKGTPAADSNITQYGDEKELERVERNFESVMGGLVIMAGYGITF